MSKKQNEARLQARVEQAGVPPANVMAVVRTMKALRDAWVPLDDSFGDPLTMLRFCNARNDGRSGGHA